ncbi:hypothetical protein [Nocardia sp. NPDC003963]
MSRRPPASAVGGVTTYPVAATSGAVAGGCAIDGVVGGVEFVGAAGSVVFGAVVVGDAGVVDISDDVDTVVELAGVVVVVLVGAVVVVVPVGAVMVLVGAVVVVVGTVVVAVLDVTVIVDGSADAVTELGSAVTVTVDVSVGGVVTVTVDIGVEETVPGTCTLNEASTEKLAVAEKLALIEPSVEFAGELSVVVAVIDSVAVAVPISGSVESAAGRVAPVSVTASAPGSGTSLGTSDVVLVFVTLVRLRPAL